jgi:uridine kinase
MLVIGIAGGTGSGKTTVVNQIIQELPEGEVWVISQDS